MCRKGKRFSLIQITAALLGLSMLLSSPSSVFAGDRIWIPIRWCGIHGATSIDNPSEVGESTVDNVLWRRHERPTDLIYHGTVNMSFRAGATEAIKNGPQSFPIIFDPSGSGGDLINSTENSDAVSMCRRAWTMGDPLYFDQNNNSTVNLGTDTVLSTNSVTIGNIDLGQNGAPLVSAPADIKFVDADSNSTFDMGENIYRDENNNNIVDSGDTLLVNTLETVVGGIDGADVGSSLLAVPSQVKYLDLILEPANTYNIGYPAVQGITSVSANDVEFTGIAFPVHGVAISGIGGLGVTMDDPAQYLPPGPDYTLFEVQLVAHEFGHSLSLTHGDGIDDDMDGLLDEPDDPTAPVPGAGAGTLCDSNNVMSYCWLDNGTSGNPDLEFIGVGSPTISIFTGAQSDKLRDFALTNVPDRVVDPVIPPLVSARIDPPGDVPEEFGYIDITDFSVRVDNPRLNTIFALSTRRPLPDSNPQSEFHFLVDIDGNSATGGAPSTLPDPIIKSDFSGVEFIITARFRGRELESVRFFQYMPVIEAFERVRLDKLDARMEPIIMIPDFPMGSVPDPDGGQIAPIEGVPVAEMVSISIPNQILVMPTDNNFSVEYIAVDIDTETTDVAKSVTMNFDLPVFPDCYADPPVAPRGSTTKIISSGLLADREVHLLLGDIEVGSGMTDSDGQVTLEFKVPEDARLGERLVTVGAAAVSADCSLIVTDENDNGHSDQDDSCCNRQPTLPVIQLWIIIFLLIVIIILLIWKCFRRKQYG